METFLTSLGTYVLIDLVSLAILVAFKDTFIRAARLGFERLNIRPVVNNYNTYSRPSSSVDDDEEYTGEEEAFNFDDEDADEEDTDEEEESTSELLERMGGENILYGTGVNDEEDDNKPQ